MAYVYLDDSKHHRFGFSLAAFVICDTDPTEHVSSIFQNQGYDPEEFEYKSSAKMAGDVKLQALRDALKSFIGMHCRIAVCVVDDDKRLGPAGLSLLKSALSHPKLQSQSHTVFFDEGLFRSPKAAADLSDMDPAFARCDFHFEQDSRKHLGIQLADIVAHTCSTMLLDALGYVTKKVVLDAPEDSVYDGLEVELGFEMWAGIRYAFLAQNKKNPKDDFDLATVDVYPWGLFIDESVSGEISAAAMERFGENYLGCIH
ncbi:DUF3800 domain-containing protein [Phaeobacter inhibens]|uniref:DUF3800 domain-containing protein n=1 Tax=Phaeobacter inhibens TaxID=221822 RepID=UPI000C9D1D2B|nr:DUF3800 domain-containing protein [Phaeobacter inhibens]AUQ65709.1 hypothetical protein PhaeoP78_00818 [Phaeobacter inhibens]